MSSFPRVKSVKPLKGKRLLVTFHNGVTKIYDCVPLFQSEAFQSLTDEMLFRAVRTDPGGYGISWNEEIDLSEAELWVHGQPVTPHTEQHDPKQINDPVTHRTLSPSDHLRHPA